VINYQRLFLYIIAGISIKVNYFGNSGVTVLFYKFYCNTASYDLQYRIFKLQIYLPIYLLDEAFRFHPWLCRAIQQTKSAGWGLSPDIT